MMSEEILGIEPFSREEYCDVLAVTTGQKSKEALIYSFRTDLSKGSIVRVGWNRYVRSDGKQRYNFSYSELSKDIAVEIQVRYLDVGFRIFEMDQLNECLNSHAFHNQIFVYVEKGHLQYYYDELQEVYPGRVILMSSEEYLDPDNNDKWFVICRLPSESPKGYDLPWHSRPETILVDICTDRYLSKVIPENERKHVFMNLFSRYIINTNTMFRYARRKGAEAKFREAFDTYISKC